MNDLDWEIAGLVIHRDYWEFMSSFVPGNLKGYYEMMADVVQKEIDSMRIVQLCLTGE